MDIGEYHGEEKKHQGDDRFASDPFLASGSQDIKRSQFRKGFKELLNKFSMDLDTSKISNLVN